MKRKEGISLIVLIITIIVVIILAVAVILSIANNNPIENAQKAVAANNEAALKEEATLLYSDWYLKENTGKSTGLSAAAYIKSQLSGKYDEDLLARLTVTNSGSIIILDVDIKIGDKVKYELDSSKSRYVATGNSGSQTISQEDLEWVYMGVSEKGNVLLTSKTFTSGIVWLSKNNYGYVGYEAFENGPAYLDEICENLYSTNLGTARNMKVEDVNSLLGYTKNEGYYKTASDEPKWTSISNTVGDLESYEGATITQFNGYTKGNEYKKLKLNRYVYDLDEYKDSKGYSLVACGSGEYWLSSQASYANFADGKLCLGMMHVSYDCEEKPRAHKYLNNSKRYVEMFTFVDTSGVTNKGFDLKYRPVVELNSNVELSKNSSGEYVLNVK